MNHCNSQIMLAMSTFDLSGCIAWCLSTVAIPKYTSSGAPTFIYGAEGNNIRPMWYSALKERESNRLYHILTVEIQEGVKYFPDAPW
jgi:hypothetical protein